MRAQRLKRIKSALNKAYGEASDSTNPNRFNDMNDLAFRLRGMRQRGLDRGLEISKACNDAYQRILDNQGSPEVLRTAHEDLHLHTKRQKRHHDNFAAFNEQTKMIERIEATKHPRPESW